MIYVRVWEPQKPEEFRRIQPTFEAIAEIFNCKKEELQIQIHTSGFLNVSTPTSQICVVIAHSVFKKIL